MTSAVPMDRELPSIARRAHRLKTARSVLLPLARLAVVIALLPGWIRPTLSRARVRTAIVQAGPVEAVISTKPQGQGIGLTLVREILSGHGFDYALETNAC